MTDKQRARRAAIAKGAKRAKKFSMDVLEGYAIIGEYVEKGFKRGVNVLEKKVFIFPPERRDYSE